MGVLPVARGCPLRLHSFIKYIFIAASILFLLQWTLTTSFDLSSPPQLRTSSQGINETLGFGSIYVVSGKDSPRRRKLIQAANVTELQLKIPDQPSWSDEDVAKFKTERNSRVGRGSMLAWMGHLHVLREFLETGDETALFLEDDVDWDVRLRSVQVPLLSRAAQSIFSDTTTRRRDVVKYPYGSPDRWDLLYLGHCGDFWHGTDVGFEDGHVKPPDLQNTPHATFADPTLPKFDKLHPWTASLLQNLGVPEHTRLLHRSKFPLCTFAYAVSRATAQRLLSDLAGSEKENEPTAYDVAVLEACRDKGLRCWSANSELFHHIQGQSMISGVDGHKSVPPVDQAVAVQAELSRETPNIACGFWDGAFEFSDRDQLERLREASRKGVCMKEVDHPAS